MNMAPLVIYLYEHSPGSHWSEMNTALVVTDLYECQRQNKVCKLAQQNQKATEETVIFWLYKAHALT